jgi:hypothetical protein
MSTPEQGPPPLADGTDIRADPDDLETEQAPPTSVAEEYREDAETLGGTGGLDAGGAG